MFQPGMNGVGTLEERAQMAWRMAQAGERMRDRLEERHSAWADPRWIGLMLLAFNKVGRDIRFCLMLIDRYERAAARGEPAPAERDTPSLPQPAPDRPEPAECLDEERERFNFGPERPEDPERGMPASLPILARQMGEHIADLQVIADTADAHTDIYTPAPFGRAIARARSVRRAAALTEALRRDSG